MLEKKQRYIRSRAKNVRFKSTIVIFYQKKLRYLYFVGYNMKVFAVAINQEVLDYKTKRFQNYKIKKDQVQSSNQKILGFKTGN